ncbi:MAG TPA: hypothetical protein VM327_03250 [Candidatus Thermoplasmatota archaeon]|nr:hypothetical protein [Candidatus Thermoplasmatota archaeon]
MASKPGAGASEQGPLAEQPRDEYYRWRDHRVGQMSVATAVLVTLALAQLGFQTSQPNQDAGALQFYWRAGIALAAISIVAGVALVWNRLQDFRYTGALNRRLWEKERREAGLTELRVISGSMPKASIEELDCMQRMRGRLTWALFRIQAVLWTCGVVAVAAWAWLKA